MGQKSTLERLFFEENYLRYHGEIFDAYGYFKVSEWEDWDGPKADLCGMALSKISFTATIIFLWTIRSALF